MVWLPLWVPLVGGEVLGGQGLHLTVGDLDAGGVGAGVALGVDAQAGAGGGVAAIRLTATSWLVSGLAGPAQAGVAEQAVLDPVPFGGPGRHVGDRDRYPDLVGEGGQLLLPPPGPVAVGAAGVRGDQQLRGVRVGGPADGGPPAADGLHGKRGGVAVVADRDPAGVGAQVAGRGFSPDTLRLTRVTWQRSSRRGHTRA